MIFYPALYMPRIIYTSSTINITVLYSFKDMCRYSPATLISHVGGLVTYENCLHNTSYKWINYIHPENAHSGLQLW